MAYGALAGVREKQQKYDAAFAARETAMGMLLPIVNADPQNATLRAGLAYTQRQIAQTLNLMGQHQKALEYAVPAVAAFEAIIAASGPNPANIGI